MDNKPSNIISAIVHNEAILEQIIDQLESGVVARHQISIQGSPSELVKRFDAEFIDPEIIQNSDNPPKKEPFLVDDFGWVIGFSLAIPVFICSIIGFLIFGNPQSEYSYYLSSAIGVLIGAGIGALIGTTFVKLVKKQRNMKIRKQEEKGGFVLWVSASSDEQKAQIISILEQYSADHIIIK